MREQIEQLIAELEAQIQYRHNNFARGVALTFDADISDVIDRLRAILASPDAVSAEKGTTARD